MATDPGFMQHIHDQLRDVAGVSSRRMFGEYALYVHGKVVALVCDDRLFVKPTDAGRAILGQPTEAPPYPGAKPHFAMDDHLDDRDLLAHLIRTTHAALPAAKAKQPPKPRKTSPKNASPKNASPKKASPKKASPKKAAPKNAAPRPTRNKTSR
jgi:DNA transformation protein and related proteins